MRQRKPKCNICRTVVDAYTEEELKKMSGKFKKVGDLFFCFKHGMITKKEVYI